MKTQCEFNLMVVYNMLCVQSFLSTKTVRIDSYALIPKDITINAIIMP